MMNILRSLNTIHKLHASRMLRARSQYLSSTTSHTTPAKSDRTSSPVQEQDIISQLTPLKKILCLCPIPLGRERVSWSGGDSFVGDETIHMNFRKPEMQTNQPIVRKYRYGERYVIGAAISDAYLTHAEPINPDKEYVAEMVPSFRCDTHNLGSSPILHCNLPYFRHDFLRSIGHFDIGAVVISMPMKPTTNPFNQSPTRVQLEQERKLDIVRENIMGLLQNYVCQEGDEFDDVTSNEVGNKGSQRLGPLGLQGFINHRMSLEDVLSKTYDSGRGSWGHLTRAVRQIQNQHTIGGGGNAYFAGNQIHGSHNTFTSIPPEIHAAVALNAMMEKYTSTFHSSFF